MWKTGFRAVWALYQKHQSLPNGSNVLDVIASGTFFGFLENHSF
jgi:hypothetical protein